MPASAPNPMVMGIALGFCAACAAGFASTVFMYFLGINSLLIKMGVDAALGALLVAILTLQPWVKELSQPKLRLPLPEETSLLIQKRRSIFLKDFNGEEVEDSKVQAMLDAANWAPTHGKTEPWRFVVFSGMGKDRMTSLTIEHVRTTPNLTDEQRSKKLAKFAKKQTQWAKASYMIAIVMKRYAVEGKEQPEWEETAAVACSVQNMYLMATSLGVATYWSSWDAGARDCPEMRDLLELDHAEDKCLGFFMVGSADAEVKAAYRSKRGDIRDKVMWIEK